MEQRNRERKPTILLLFLVPLSFRVFACVPPFRMDAEIIGKRKKRCCCSYRSSIFRFILNWIYRRPISYSFERALARLHISPPIHSPFIDGIQTLFCIRARRPKNFASASFAPTLRFRILELLVAWFFVCFFLKPLIYILYVKLQFQAPQ